MEIINITELDDYSVASQYLIELALTTGNGKMLRAINTLMDAVIKASALEEQGEVAQNVAK